MAITKEEVLNHQLNRRQEFVEQLINQLETAIFYAAARQHHNLRHPFHPLLESYIVELGKNGFEIEKDGLTHFIISW